MRTDTAAILPLTAETASLLRASHLLPSLPATLSHLLLHLLELVPAPFQLSLTLEPAKWGFTIQLDSKDLELESFGQILTSQEIELVSQVGLLELEGRDRAGAQRTCSMKGGVHLYDGPSRANSRNTGLTLSLRDLYHNIPVRRRAAASPSALQSRCLRFIQQLSLARFWLAFSVWEPHKEDLLWSVRAASSPEERFAQLHGSTLLTTPTAIDIDSPLPTRLRLTGFISLAASHSRSTEYLSVNSRPLSHSSSPLHVLIEDLFATSTFAERSQAETEPGLSGASPVKVHRGTGNGRSPRKAVRRPVCVLNLMISSSEIVWEGGEEASIEFEDWPRVKSFVAGIIRGFLAQHGLLRSSRKTSSIDKRSLLFNTAPLAETSELANQMDGPLEKWATRSLIATPDPNVILYRNLTTGKVPKLDRTNGPSFPIGSLVGFGTAEEVRGSTPAWLTNVLNSWDNPAFRVRSEANISALTSPQPGFKESPRLPFHATSSLLKTAHGLSTQQIQRALSDAEVGAQVDDKFLTCFLRISRPASILDLSSEDRERSLLFVVDQHAADERIRVERYLRQLGTGFLVNCQRGATLPIDRLDAIPLVTPSANTFILLTASEHQMLASSHEARLAFARWGVTFDLPSIQPPSEHDVHVQIRVLTVPSVVAERLLGRKHLKEGPAELTELVKSYLGWLDEEGGADRVCTAASLAGVIKAGESKHETDWMTALRFCPQEILDLVNSKACRGAIMFGDRLSSAHGTHLVRSLSNTSLPLQCAHGRPSMALLADLSALARRSGGSGRAGSTINWDVIAPASHV